MLRRHRPARRAAGAPGRAGREPPELHGASVCCWDVCSDAFQANGVADLGRWVRRTPSGSGSVAAGPLGSNVGFYRRRTAVLFTTGLRAGARRALRPNQAGGTGPAGAVCRDTGLLSSRLSRHGVPHGTQCPLPVNGRAPGRGVRFRAARRGAAPDCARAQQPAGGCLR